MKKCNSKISFLIGLCCLAISGACSAGELVADINNDGIPETLKWEKFGSTELGDYYQLQVIKNGRILWSGPKEKSDSNPLISLSTDVGVSFPEILYDIDGDGYTELLAPEPQSDVSPTYFRILKWRDETFEIMPSYALMLTEKEFVWKASKSQYGTWISHFYSDYHDGFIKVDVVSYEKDETYRFGVALIKFVANGAVVKRWIKPIFPDDKTALETAYQSYYKAFQRYTTLVTTPNKVGDIQEALKEYREKYWAYQKIKNSQSKAVKTPKELSSIDGIVSIDSAVEKKKVPLLSTFMEAEKYHYGIGVKVNHAKSLTLYKRAKREGDTHALMALAAYYEEGVWVKRDLTKAKSLLQEAVKKGYVEAKWQLEFLENEEQ